jgi:FtsP/CotA-like multicopper oxidase with cupredoxin domain
MAAFVGDTGIIFGIVDPKPLKGFPPGKVRLRIRNGSFALARVRDERGIREFLIRERDGFWTPYLESGRNLATPLNAELSSGGAPTDE